jgi:nucleotide-binding universal stress UspA family protein
MMDSYKHIAVATDGSSCAQAAGSEAARLASALGARLTLIYVFDPVKYVLPEGYVPYTPDQFATMTDHFQAMLRREKERLEQAGASSVDTRLLQGTATEEINNFAKETNVSLIVVGTHGRGALARMLLGSTAESLVRSASVPVLTVRHPEN